jgi:hypothetical protein
MKRFSPIFHPKIPQSLQFQDVGILPNPPAPKKDIFCAKSDLKKILPFDDMYPFKKAKLNDCGGDLNGRWYIEFYGWDVQKRKTGEKTFLRGK